jgi:heme exporter protein CcmD
MIEFITTDRYAVYVVSAYGATAAILGWLIWSTLAANARARREMAEAESRRKR